MIRTARPFAALALISSLGACFVPVVVPITLPAPTPNLAQAGEPPKTATCTPAAGAAATESTLIARINAERGAAGLPHVTRSAALNRVAQGHACDNAAHGSNGHSGSDGSTLSTRLVRGGIALQTAAENTGLGYTGVDMAMTRWMASAGHRKNILNPQVTQAALGMATANGQGFWVLDLVAPR